MRNVKPILFLVGMAAVLFSPSMAASPPDVDVGQYADLPTYKKEVPVFPVIIIPEDQIASPDEARLSMDPGQPGDHEVAVAPAIFYQPALIVEFRQRLCVGHTSDAVKYDAPPVAPNISPTVVQRE